MATTYSVALNGSGGALTNINLKTPARRVEILEDEAAAAQGLIWQDILDNFATTKQVTAPTEPIILQRDAGPQTSGRGRLLGFGPQTDDHGNSRVGTLLAKMKSASVNATTVRVTEYEA